MGLTTKPLLIALAVLTALLIGSGYLLKNEIQDHTETKVALETSQAALDSYILAVDQMAADQVVLSIKASEHQNNYTEAARELTKLKNRESIVLRKKGLVELKINKAFNKQQNRLACLTGDTTSCGS
jgi:uncharacterized protein (UPF0333 family)